jgi:hypothetical protein
MFCVVPRAGQPLFQTSTNISVTPQRASLTKIVCEIDKNNDEAGRSVAYIRACAVAEASEERKSFQ